MPSVRAPGQLLPLLGVVVLVLFTLGNAAANMIPVHRPSAAELRADEQRELMERRRARIAALRTRGTGCDAAQAHELARLLVMDGQFGEVRAFGAGYEQRCGDDPVVRHWSLAPAPRARR